MNFDKLIFLNILCMKSRLWQVSDSDSENNGSEATDSYLQQAASRDAARLLRALQQDGEGSLLAAFVYI